MLAELADEIMDISTSERESFALPLGLPKACIEFATHAGALEVIESMISVQSGAAEAQQRGAMLSHRIEWRDEPTQKRKLDMLPTELAADCPSRGNGNVAKARRCVSSALSSGLSTVPNVSSTAAGHSEEAPIPYVTIYHGKMNKDFQALLKNAVAWSEHYSRNEQHGRTKA